MNPPKKMKARGELTGPTKQEQKAREAKFSDVANQRVAQAIAQSQNGFKGESLNDHGLPDGHEGREIIQKKKKVSGEDIGAKFRPASYDKGVKSMSIKPKQDYNAAAKSILDNDDLYAQYKEGVASGKAFSLKVDGKVFKYAATKDAPKLGVSGGEATGNIEKSKAKAGAPVSQNKTSIKEDAAVKQPAKMSARPTYMDDEENDSVAEALRSKRTGYKS